MGNLRRFTNVAFGLVMIACSIALMLFPETALIVVAVVLGAWLVAFGVRNLVYYFSMARHMVGGLSLLFVALIAIDLGAFAFTLINNPRPAVVLYLIGCNAFTGLVSIMRAVESKSLDSRWKPSLIHGIISFALVVTCLVFMGSDQIIVAILCFGLIYGACVRIASAARPTEIVYIQ